MKVCFLLSSLLLAHPVLAQTDATDVAGKIGNADLYLVPFQSAWSDGNIPSCFTGSKITEGRNRIAELKAIDESPLLTSEQSCHVFSLEFKIYYLLINKEIYHSDPSITDAIAVFPSIKENLQKHPHCIEALTNYIWSAIKLSEIPNVFGARSKDEARLGVNSDQLCKDAEAKMKTLETLEPNARDILGRLTSPSAVSSCLSK